MDELALTKGAASTLQIAPQNIIVGSPAQILCDYWNQGGVLIVVGAIGAVIRLVAPLIRNKEEDPAVIVIDARTFFVVPLLGGHKAGAENLASQLAEDLDAIPVITGGTNSQECLPLDSFGEAWGWTRSGSSKCWKDLMLSQASKKRIELEQKSGSSIWQESVAAKNSFKGFSEEDPINYSGKLFIGSSLKNKCGWHPATLWIGVGCERFTSQKLIEKALFDSLLKNDLALQSIAGLASIDIKFDEPGLIGFANSRGWPIRLFKAEDLSRVSVPNPSKLVEAEVGTPSVSEAAALLAAERQSEFELIQPKIIYSSDVLERGSVTIAIAEAKQPFAPKLGELHLVGSGPGDISMLTQDARYALARSAVWLGYGRYLDLLAPLLRKDQVLIKGQLTRERDRCNEALALSKQGIRVALVSSGDSGIYGMAGLALELWLDLPKSDRPKFQVHPGISSLQMAAAKAGAPLMHDFCAISLSDRLTPWLKIEDRVKAAAQGDFVVALYNPRSEGRNWQLQRAIDLFLECRLSSTPVVLARQLGRKEENIQIHSLGKLPVNEVDMLTILLVGNRTSFVKDGWIVTPRGY